MTRQDIELMAPVGSYETLMAAIQGGANSVYFGIEHLNMRSKSTVNFTLNDLQKISEIARENNIKTYLTLNTVIYDGEIELMKSIVDAAKENNITAIIASDQAVINYATSRNCEVHLSTQLNISNSETVKFYSRYATVMVLARELNLTQVQQIAQTIENENILGPDGNPVKLEMFVHGALCMSISGKCYLSLHEKNYSANRGQCLQNCRRKYHVTDVETGNELEIDHEYIMSPRDLCTINFLNKLLDAGVKVMKIEGRARAPEYVKTVVKCYREAIDAYFDGTYNQEKIDNWMERLKTVFNRGFWDGYYLGRKLGEWNHEYGSLATKVKLYVGKCTNYFSKINIAEILIETNELTVGDEIIIIGPTTGVVETKVGEIRLDNRESTETAVKGNLISIPVTELIRRGDKLYKLIPAKKEF